MKNHEDNADAEKWSRMSEIDSAIKKRFGKKLSELRTAFQNSESDDEKRLIKFQMQDVAQQALDFRDDCMSGEISDPVRYVTYDPLGAYVRDELISLSEFEGEDYDYTYIPNADAPNIEGHKNTDDEKALYTDIYNRWYSDLAEQTISSDFYQNAEPEKRADLLEGVRENAYAFAKQEWAKQLGLKGGGYDPDNVDDKGYRLISSGIDSGKVTQLLDDIQQLEPLEGAKDVSVLQKMQTITAAKYLSDKEKDAALRAYTGDGQEKYIRWTKAGASPDVYVGIMTEISRLKPISGNTSVTDAQQLEVIANYHGIGDGKRWDMMRAFYTGEKDNDEKKKNREKLTAAQNAGFTASSYIDCRMALNSAKGHDLDGNGKTDSNSVRNAKAALIRGFNISDELKNFLWSMDYPKQEPDGWKYDKKEGKG